MECRGRSFNWFTFVLFCFFFVFVILQFLGPLMIPADSLSDLSGLVVVDDNEHIFNQLSFPWNGLYTLGDRMCHQQATRSFFFNGNQMPFCARCTALWIGITAGLGILLVFSLPLKDTFIFVILGGLLPMGIDGVGQLIGLWESTNGIRAITGMLAGIVTGLSIGIIINEVTLLYKQRKKREGDI